MKDIEFTRHATEKMAERGILRTWVERTIRNPAWIEPETRYKDAERRFAEVAEFGGRLLRMVCVETQGAIRVITATFDRGARKRR
jgi:uncharacterized DUF497 family protein